MPGREYERTHPWISFAVDLRSAPARLWLLLGEASAMCEHIASAPVRPAVSKEMHGIYLAKGALATTAIEGNTLSEEDVRAEIEGRLELPPSKAYLQQEVKNIIDACNEILDQIRNDSVPAFDTDLIKSYNERVLRGLDNGDVVPGEVSEYEVVVGNVYKGAPRRDCEHLLRGLSSFLNSMGVKLWDDWSHDTTIPMAILKSVIAHLYIAWIHPFGDGNGRTARLIEFQLLARAGVPSPAAHLLSNHYNETKTEYYRQLDHASKSGGDVFHFLLYAVQGFVDGLREQVDFVQREHMDSAWDSFVLEQFRNMKRSEASTRQRDLVLDLSLQPGAVHKSKMVELTPRLARAYAGKTTKTLTRDLNRLEGLGLIRQVFGGYVANTDLMLGFMPVRRDATDQQPAGPN